MRHVAVIGNLGRDVVGHSRPRAGGAVFHAARALRLLGIPARILTRCAASDRAELLPPLVSLGIPVSWRPARATASFAFRYSGEQREMTVTGIGDPWTPNDLRDWAIAELGRVEWVHVGALARSDFPADTLGQLARGRKLLLDGQGLVRPSHTGRLELNGGFDPAVLEHIAALKLAEEEALALDLHPDQAAPPAQLGVPEVIVTLGSRGVVVYADGMREAVAVRPVRARIDPTGAGDAFAVAYVAGRSAGARPGAAARRAASLVADLLSASKRS